ncbi:nitroreductase [SAR202 cluster bacterium AD-804-J14_MRT_500m]|nr:nitroreductase [SAR202 cluster bacterium AD-804-J14_MRT_500m]
MDVYKAIRSRVAVREFTSDMVPDHVICKIVRAARWAPSQRNRQPWHFIVIKSKDTLEHIGTLAPSGEYIATAPTAIAVIMSNSRMAQFDSARAIENMILTAWSEGIGTCYVGGIDREAVKHILGVPKEMELITVMPFGFPTDAAKTSGKHRKSLSEIVHQERFGTRYV